MWLTLYFYWARLENKPRKESLKKKKPNYKYPQILQSLKKEKVAKRTKTTVLEN